jgi:hypothetical protein
MVEIGKFRVREANNKASGSDDRAFDLSTPPRSLVFNNVRSAFAYTSRTELYDKNILENGKPT